MHCIQIRELANRDREQPRQGAVSPPSPSPAAPPPLPSPSPASPPSSRPDLSVRYSTRINNIPRSGFFSGLDSRSAHIQTSNPIIAVVVLLSLFLIESQGRALTCACMYRACETIERAVAAVYTVDNGGHESEGRTCDYVPA